MAKHKGHLGLGIIMAISFFVVLFLFFSPIFPKAPDGSPQNGFDFADRMFNRLSKGSSYFVAKLSEENRQFIGKNYAVTVDMKTPEDADHTMKLFGMAGAQVEIAGTALTITGDLGTTLQAVLNDADAMYHNDGTKVSGLYGYDEKKVLRNWHEALGQMDKAFKKDGRIPEANMVSDTMKKGLEAAYNFYGVAPQKVSDHIGLMTGLLVFYVIYTMWWGYAIFYIFEGIGLSMKKAKVKKEV